MLTMVKFQAVFDYYKQVTVRDGFFMGKTFKLHDRSVKSPQEKRLSEEQANIVCYFPYH